MGKAFVLEEEGPLVVMGNVPAVVGRLVKEIEEGEEVWKVRADGIVTGGAGTGIEHVDNVKGNEEAGLLDRFVNVRLDKKA